MITFMGAQQPQPQNARDINICFRERAPIMPTRILGVVGDNDYTTMRFAGIPQIVAEQLVFLKLDNGTTSKMLLTYDVETLKYSLAISRAMIRLRQNLQVQVETSGDVVWQSEIWTMGALDTIDADATLAIEQAPYLQALDLRVADGVARAEAAAQTVETAVGGIGESVETAGAAAASATTSAAVASASERAAATSASSAGASESAVLAAASTATEKSDSASASALAAAGSASGALNSASMAAASASTATQKATAADASASAAAESAASMESSVSSASASATAAAGAAAAASGSETAAAASATAAAISADDASAAKEDVVAVALGIAQQVTAAQVLAQSQLQTDYLSQIAENGMSGSLNGFSLSLGADGKVTLGYTNPEDETSTASAVFPSDTTGQLIVTELADMNTSLRSIIAAEKETA